MMSIFQCRQIFHTLVKCGTTYTHKNTHTYTYIEYINGDLTEKKQYIAEEAAFHNNIAIYKNTIYEMLNF